MKKINWLNFSVLVVYPLSLLFAFIVYLQYCTVTKTELLLFVITYYTANISVGVGLHRLWAHHSYKVNKVVEFFLILFSAGTLQGPALVWSSDHYYHHSLTDKEGDPHSPLKYSNKIKGFLWSHMGWMLFQQKIKINPIVLKKFSRNKLVMWQYKYYWQIATFMNTVFPLTVGYLVYKTIPGALTAYLFIGLARALQQQMTFCVNSVCHVINQGRKYTKGTASDLWWMSIFLLGENWHNFHHAFPSDYRNGIKWYHFDVHKWIIFVLSKLNLAWELNKTSEVRVDRKVCETLEYYKEINSREWKNITDKAHSLKELMYKKISEVNFPSEGVKSSFLHNFKLLNELVESITASATRFLSSNKKSEKVIEQMYKKLNKIESSINQLIEEKLNLDLSNNNDLKC